MTLTTKYVLNLLTAMVLAVFVTSVLFGWSEFIDKLGGLKSFGGLIALLTMGIVTIGGIIYLMRSNYENRNSAFVRDLILAVLAVAILAAISWSWVDLPNGTGARLLLCIGVCGIAAAITTWFGYVDDE
jgi:hypothetical protein